MSKEQYISYLLLSQAFNTISVIMLLHTFNIISLIPSMRKGYYVIPDSKRKGKKTKLDMCKINKQMHEKHIDQLSLPQARDHNAVIITRTKSKARLNMKLNRYNGQNSQFKT